MMNKVMKQMITVISEKWIKWVTQAWNFYAEA